jgi:3-oxoacid CoA-transferase subunit B
MYVNLGIGIPTLCALYVPEEYDIQLQSENGFLGLGEFPAEGEQDPDLINAGKQTVTTNPGAVFFGSSDSFGMIRGAHIDVCVLGAFQVSYEGDMANWIIPGKKVNGMGGAMDLVNGAKKHIIVMEHTNKGKPKLKQHCTIPLTGKRCVDMLITEMGVFGFNHHQMHLNEIAEGITVEDMRAVTEADFIVSDNLKTF